jgi:EAL domain-containing protein (putative c-di-GMP-specific phosphodiesterase class I)
VIFEIVESEGIENYDDVKEFINVTKSYGAQIAIDDFGTGFSNFHYLFKLNVDLIKIDGSIIQQINGEKAASLVAETIVDFSRKMGIATVAEFVSDEAIFKKTNELGINYSQGYYVSMPREVSH